ncbi:basic amino acid ABC transporter substrate-binding protein [Carboxydocella sp. ULO1]|uniref:basic amino acid ABC transporter substrate-binding protein n=1 Tax=Carboxydocella sp. ULO1 TaxID=1926599 RepID=UPI0009ADC770|nr:basic amino acid ABC transporter substrate-binding protein [Carboxydocella sp. ULO1]GAW29317.1 Extracellular solute-binding protein family 3 [Carboxydocella sp. ULO1]
MVFYKKLASMLLAASLVLTLAGCGGGQAAEEKKQGNEGGKQKIVVGTDAAYAPFEYVEEGTGKIVGFDAELMQAIGEAAGLEVEMKNIGWDGLIPGLKSGSVDAVISAMTITEERAREVSFSEPYFKAVQYIAIKEGAPYSKPEDLVGKKIGVQLNTTGHFAAEKIPGVNKADIRTFDTTPAALTELVNGGVEAVVADSPVVLEFIKKNPNAKVTYFDPKFPQEDNYGIAVKKENTELLNKINEGLKKVKESGKYDELYKKYFGV